MMEKVSPHVNTVANSGTIVIPRPKSVFSKKDASRLDESYQLWMQQYHRQHQHHRNQQLMKARSAVTTVSPQNSPNEFSKAATSPNNSISKKSRGSNLFLNFNSLKTSPNDNINTVKKISLASTTEEGKKDQQTETLGGYKIYKGAGNFTLGLSKQNITSTVSESKNNHENTADTINGTVFPPYTPLILPDKFILAPGKSHSQDNKSTVRLSSQQPLKQTTTPFHIQLHPQRRPRPHSASLDFSAHHSNSPKDKNGQRTKGLGKNTKSMLQTSYKAPSVTTIQLHSSEAIALTPRSTSTISPNNVSLDTGTGSIETKLEQQNAQPKSILKNNNESSIQSPHTIQVGFANYSKTLPLSHQKVRHEFAYHELIVSPGKNQNVSALTIPRHCSLSQRSSITGTESKRPKSASATPSKYELIDRSSTPRRKSVTFNSYVSFSSDSRVSTIRALPVDV